MGGQVELERKRMIDDDHIRIFIIVLPPSLPLLQKERANMGDDAGI